MTYAYFDSLALPLDFTYTYEWKVRVAVNQTIAKDVVQSHDYYEGDERVRFTCKFAPLSVHEKFRDCFQSVGTYAFTDYDGLTRNVILLEYTSEEHAGMYDISGLMKVVV